MPPPALPSIILRRTAETLLIAFAGGAALGLLDIPAGWLTGAMLAVLAAGFAGRPVMVPPLLAQIIFVFLGISLGAAVTPETLGRMGSWPGSLIMLGIGMTCATVAIMIYLQQVHGWDATASLFAAAPGALSQSLAMAVDCGADVRSIAVVQTARLLVLTAVLPLAIAASFGGGVPPPLYPLIAWQAALPQLVLLILVSTAVALAAHRARLPGGLIVGAMIGSSVLHGAGLVTVNLPPVVVLSCFAILGALIATRFAGIDVAQMRKLARAALGAFLVGSVVAFAFALLTAWLLALPVADLMVAFAPGALETMIVIAFALHLDPAFVGAHHLARFLMVSLTLPVVVVWLRRGTPR